MNNTIFKTSLLALAVALCVEASAASTAKITFKTEAEVKPGGSVVLSDIAGIQGSKALAEKIGQVVVAQAPMAGYSRTLDANYIKQKICLAAPNSAISTSGANAILISGICIKITAVELVETTKQFVTEHLPKDSKTYEVNVDQISRDIIAPAGADVRIEPQLLSTEVHAGLNPVKLVVKADGRTVSTTFASARIKVTAMVLVATDVIEKGAPLTAQNTTWDTRDISKTADAITNNGSDTYLTMVAKKTIRPGSVLVAGDAELPAAVKTGDSIIIMVKTGNVVLTVTGEAKQSGKIGDTIRVTTPVSSDEVRAKITEPGMAEIRG